MKDLLAELEEDTSEWVTTQTYLWGLDLTQSFEGAGGVGGLLAITRNDGPGTTNYYPTYDANGNVMELWDELGNNVAIYRYGPFGELVSISESVGVRNPYKFSTKYFDEELELYYYGYRYYGPETGRWLNRDPIEERGGLNLYGFVGNDGIGKWDLLGLIELTFAYITRIETATITDPFGRIFNGGIKTTQTVSIDPDECQITWSSRSIGRTDEYDLSGAVIRSARASGSSIEELASRPSKDTHGFCKCVLKMKGNEGNPLAQYAPNITYNVTIEFDSRKREYEWKVSYDQFPSHMLTGHTGIPLLNFSHVGSGTKPTALLPMVSNGNASGTETY